MYITNEGRRGRDFIIVGFTATYAINDITTNDMSSNRVHDVINFVSDLWQVVGFLRLLHE